MTVATAVGNDTAARSATSSVPTDEPRVCSKTGCRNMMALGIKFKTCDSCRAQGRITSRNKREKQALKKVGLLPETSGVPSKRKALRVQGNAKKPRNNRVKSSTAVTGMMETLYALDGQNILRDQPPASVGTRSAPGNLPSPQESGGGMYDLLTVGARGRNPSVSQISTAHSSAVLPLPSALRSWLPFCRDDYISLDGVTPPKKQICLLTNTDLWAEHRKRALEPHMNSRGEFIYSPTILRTMSNRMNASVSKRHPEVPSSQRGTAAVNRYLPVSFPRAFAPEVIDLTDDAPEHQGTSPSIRQDSLMVDSQPSPSISIRDDARHVATPSVIVVTPSSHSKGKHGEASPPGRLRLRMTQGPNTSSACPEEVMTRNCETTDCANTVPKSMPWPGCIKCSLKGKRWGEASRSSETPEMVSDGGDVDMASRSRSHDATDDRGSNFSTPLTPIDTLMSELESEAVHYFTDLDLAEKDGSGSDLDSDSSLDIPLPEGVGHQPRLVIRLPALKTYTFTRRCTKCDEALPQDHNRKQCEHCTRLFREYQRMRKVGIRPPPGYWSIKRKPSDSKQDLKAEEEVLRSRKRKRGSYFKHPVFNHTHPPYMRLTTLLDDMKRQVLMFVEDQWQEIRAEPIPNLANSSIVAMAEDLPVAMTGAADHPSAVTSAAAGDQQSASSLTVVTDQPSTSTGSALAKQPGTPVAAEQSPFKFCGECSEVVDHFHDAVRIEERVSDIKARLKTEFGIELVLTSMLEIASGGIMHRFGFIHEILPEAMMPALPDPMPALPQHHGSSAQSAPRGPSGQLDIGIVPDTSHRHFQGQKTTIEFQLVF